MTLLEQQTQEFFSFLVKTLNEWNDRQLNPQNIKTNIIDDIDNLQNTENKNTNEIQNNSNENTDNENTGNENNNNDENTTIKKNSYNYNKIISLIICISGIYHLYYSYSKTKNTRNELNLTKEILEEYKNKPIPTGEAHEVVKKLNDDLNSTLEKYNKELSSFLNYNYLLLSIWTVIVILLILITIKIFFNHQK